MYRLHTICFVITSCVFNMTSLLASAQYVELKNRDGKAITVVPLEKSGFDLRMRTKDGREFVLPINKLSDADQEFILKWSPPEIKATIVALPTALGNADPGRHHVVDIEVSDLMKLPGKTLAYTNNAISFRPTRQQELMDALDEFIRDSEDPIKQSSKLYESYDLMRVNKLHQASKCTWHVGEAHIGTTNDAFFHDHRYLSTEDRDQVVRKVIREGRGKTERVFKQTSEDMCCSIYLNHAYYLLDFLQRYDSSNEARKYSELQKRNR